MQRTMLCDDTVFWLSGVRGDERLFSCGARRDGAVFISTFINGQLHKTVWLSEADGTLPFANECTIDFALVCSCTSNGNRAVTGHKDGRIQKWNAETGKAMGDALHWQKSGVECVTLFGALHGQWTESSWLLGHLTTPFKYGTRQKGRLLRVSLGRGTGSC